MLVSFFQLTGNKNLRKKYKFNKFDVDKRHFECYTKQAHSKECAFESLKTVYDEINVTLKQTIQF